MRLSFVRGAALGAATAVLTLGTTAALAGTGTALLGTWKEPKPYIRIVPQPH